MFYLKCQKKTLENSVLYIWANKNDLTEWCVSKYPCLFEDFKQIATLKSIVEETSSLKMTIEESSSNLKNIIKMEKEK